MLQHISISNKLELSQILKKKFDNGFHKILSSTTVSNIDDNNKKSFFNTKSAY